MNIIKTPKVKILILTLLLMLAATGCARFDIDLGIDPNNTAYLTYNLEIDVSDFDENQQHNFRLALHELAIHYRDVLNFTINLDIDTNPLIMTADKRIANNSFEEAFETLENMLTDFEKSIFMEVDMGMIRYPKQTGYIIGAVADVPRIIKSYDTENLPPNFQESLDEAIQMSRGTITISLPADETVNASHMLNFDNRQATMTVPISFTSETAFDLSATLDIPVSLTNGTEIGTIIEQQLMVSFGDAGETALERQTRFRDIARIVTIAAAGLIALTLVITIVVVIVRKVGH